MPDNRGIADEATRLTPNREIKMPVSNLKHLGEGVARITLKSGARRIVTVAHNDRANEVLRLEIDEGAFESVSYADIKQASTMTLQMVAPPQKKAQELFLQIGCKRYQVASIEQAVAMYSQARDAADHGASEMPRVTIVNEHGTHLYGISYNGRVWDGDKPLDGMTDDQWVNQGRC